MLKNKLTANALSSLYLRNNAATMHKLQHGEVDALCKQFIEEIKLILRGKTDSNRVTMQTTLFLKDAVTSSTQEVTDISQYLPSPKFIGREEELQALHEFYNQGRHVIITGAEKVGKTALSLKYANDYQSLYSLICFIPARSAQLVVDGLHELANKVFSPQLDKSDHQLMQLKNVIEQGKEKYLLIFDGMNQKEVFNEIKEYLPNRQSCFLLTTCLLGVYNLPGFETIKLNDWKDAYNYISLTSTN